MTKHGLLMGVVSSCHSVFIKALRIGLEASGFKKGVFYRRFRV